MLYFVEEMNGFFVVCDSYRNLLAFFASEEQAQALADTWNGND